MKRICAVLASAMCAMAAWPAVASAAVVGDWELNETGGTVVHDSSGSGNDGVSQNISFSVPGAYTYNGSSSKVTVPAASSLVPGTRDIALALRFRSTFAAGSGNTDWDMVKKGGYKVEIYRRKGIDQARCSFTDTNSSKVAFQAGPNLTDGAWHTVSCTKTSSRVTLRVDGVAYTKNGTLGTVRAGKALWIGWGGDNTDFFHGTLDYVTVSIG
jgi:hypothetical protein